MNKGKLKLIFAALAATALLFSGCRKNDLEIEEGTYDSGTKTGMTTVKFKDTRYSCSANPDRIPAGGSGTYSPGKGEITFTDENIWTADFDWNLILNGTYNYTFDGKNLKLWAEKNDAGHYTYDLRKQ